MFTTTQWDQIIDSLEMAIRSHNRALHKPQATNEIMLDAYKAVIADLTTLQRKCVDERNKTTTKKQ